MKPEQREQLVTLLPRMRQAAHRARTQNEWNRIHNLSNELRDFLDCEPSDKTAAEWIVIAERETKGAEVNA